MSTSIQGQPAQNPLAANCKTTTEDVYDSQGNKSTLNYRFFKYEVTPGSNPGVVPVVAAVTKWACDISQDPLFENQVPYDASTELRTVDLSTGIASKPPGNEKITRVYNIDFDPNGAIMNPTTANTDISINRQIPLPGGGTYNMTINTDFSKLCQIAATSDARVSSQDGFGAGKLTSYSIGKDGTISGTYDNGEKKDLTKIALRNFENPGGLQQVGGTLFKDSANAGALAIDAPGVNGLGTIITSSLEMSNVDLSEEFTDMIVTERGFQANSKIITTSDEMLQELVNLKR
jgi:flagellar hook protein FlgE